eukprot:GFUD01129420.1.p1 GENE.GFUD01129420.1~~GFUD01129420.1.p1  ORF type:complete len:106 (+),score=34.70 GFUD01129420.1:48-365(+)
MKAKAPMCPEVNGSVFIQLKMNLQKLLLRISLMTTQPQQSQADSSVVPNTSSSIKQGVMILQAAGCQLQGPGHCRDGVQEEGQEGAGDIQGGHRGEQQEDQGDVR